MLIFFANSDGKNLPLKPHYLSPISPSIGSNWIPCFGVKIQQTKNPGYATNPQRALNVYKMAILSTSNRGIDILGVARANAQLSNTGEATKFYRMLLAQIDLSNNKDPIFSQEKMDFIDKNEKIRNSTSNSLVQFTFIFINSVRVIFLLMNQSKSKCNF
ncbi:unnamed protein product [Rotaria magnacalcarata]|uniref:Uncharacterized protein n=1 Tax=Rotaria magnacalcarata TaxID=392030 RepID=A0A816NAN2_9BILA|nr:unnamed protein product [Rotaria magnacalcarata]CAF3791670.1 unnamed protein product [Rotaria magnacalcarata]